MECLCLLSVHSRVVRESDLLQILAKRQTILTVPMEMYRLNGTYCDLPSDGAQTGTIEPESVHSADGVWRDWAVPHWLAIYV